MHCNLWIGPKEEEELEVVFPGGVLADVMGVIIQEELIALAHFRAFIENRRSLAISGAMRWPWSQEAWTSDGKHYGEFF